MNISDDYRQAEGVGQTFSPASDLKVPQTASIQLMFDAIKKRYSPGSGGAEFHSKNNCTCGGCQDFRRHLYFTMDARLRELGCPNYYGYRICDKHANFYSDWVPQSPETCHDCQTEKIIPPAEKSTHKSVRLMRQFIKSRGNYEIT